MELDRDADARRADDGRQHPQQLEQQGQILLLERVEEVAVPYVEPERDADIAGGDQRQPARDQPGEESVSRCGPIATRNDEEVPYGAMRRVQVSRGSPDRCG